MYDEKVGENDNYQIVGGNKDMSKSFEVMKEILRDYSKTAIEYYELLDEVTKHYESTIPKHKLSRKASNIIWKWEFEMNRRSKYAKSR